MGKGEAEGIADAEDDKEIPGFGEGEVGGGCAKEGLATVVFATGGGPTVAEGGRGLADAVGGEDLVVEDFAGAEGVGSGLSIIKC